MVKVGHKTAPGVLENSYLFEGIYQKRNFLSCSSHQTRDAVAAPQANFLEGTKLNAVNFHSCWVQQILLAIECKGISCTPCLPVHAHTQQAGPSGLLNKPQQPPSEHRSCLTVSPRRLITLMLAGILHCLSGFCCHNSKSIKRPQSNGVHAIFYALAWIICWRRFARVSMMISKVSSISLRCCACICLT